MGVILYIVSLIISPLILIAGILYGIYSGFVDQHIGNGFKNADKKFLTMAKSIDKYGNSICSELFNAVLLTKDSIHLFGNIDETISMVIGYNLMNNTLSKTGLFVNKVLNFFQKDHALKAIKNDK